MVKKIFLIAIIAIPFVFVISLILKSKKQLSESVNNKITPTPTYFITTTPKLTFVPPSTPGYKSVWITVRALDKLFLYPNFEEKLNSSVAAQEYNCAHLVSGGFFRDSNIPIGLFITEGVKISEAEENSLFNGFFSVKNNFPAITTITPTNPRLAIQSGPILILNGNAQTLSLKNDENARRIVVALNSEGQVLFLAVYDKENIRRGPKLAELPEVLLDIQKNFDLKVVSALNLDGGTHSVFLTDIAKLPETSVFGSFFCVKP